MHEAKEEHVPVTQAVRAGSRTQTSRGSGGAAGANASTISTTITSITVTSLFLSSPFPAAGPPPLPHISQPVAIARV